jgi:hypothetical protein
MQSVAGGRLFESLLRTPIAVTRRAKALRVQLRGGADLAT